MNLTFDSKGSNPSWLEDYIDEYNRKETVSYEGKLEIWHQNSTQWLIGAAQALTIGVTPPAAPVIPTKLVYGLVKGVVTTYMWQDPSLKNPPLPDVSHTNPSTPLGTGAAADKAAQDLFNSLVLKQLTDMNAKLDQLLKK